LTDRNIKHSLTRKAFTCPTCLKRSREGILAFPYPAREIILLIADFCSLSAGE
jgi:hypothetical protein